MGVGPASRGGGPAMQPCAASHAAPPVHVVRVSTPRAQARCVAPSQRRVSGVAQRGSAHTAPIASAMQRLLPAQAPSLYTPAVHVARSPPAVQRRSLGASAQRASMQRAPVASVPQAWPAGHAAAE